LIGKSRIGNIQEQDSLFKIPNTIDINNVDVYQLNDLTNAITEFRKMEGRISKTPNNPESSRSHLFIIFEIEFKDGNKGYLTIVDMAGRESPTGIFDTFFSEGNVGSIIAERERDVLIRRQTDKRELEEHRILENYENKEINKIIMEGLYINETINHLIYYFNTKNLKDTIIEMQSSDAMKYSTERYYVNPEREYEGRVEKNNNSLMIPILSYLDNLSKEGGIKPSKFIMMCMVRQENEYCEQTMETLEYANNIKSN
jgi:hypothetical protein